MEINLEDFIVKRPNISRDFVYFNRNNFNLLMSIYANNNNRNNFNLSLSIYVTIIIEIILIFHSIYVTIIIEIILIF